ncbi:MAG: DUF479 domain-containing protein [Saprospirales bacterium]|nr:DUF479 domain-containing protein [Saprospirales bacterium]
MNFLAHAYLSFDIPHLVVGNFLGDFLRHSEAQALPPSIQEGIRLHRKIDTYTDSHPSVKEGTARIRTFHGKYAPVVVDMFYDYLLSAHWKEYHELPLPQFSRSVYGILESHLPIMPSRLQERVPRMIAGDWLTSYSTPDGMVYAFDRIKYRASKPEWFENAFQNLINNWDPFVADFSNFFPDLVQYVKAEIVGME